MCGRFAFIATEETISQLGVGKEELGRTARYNIAPGAFHSIIIESGGRRHAKSMRWGLIPSWSKDPRVAFRMINARSEGISDKPAFRRPFRSQRCIVPVSGFYEWQREGKAKQPFYFKLSDQPIMALAGLYDIWQDSEGQPLYTFTIITTTANAIMNPIHDRMPVILSPDQWDTWLDPAESSPTLLESLLKPSQDTNLQCYPVSTQVNSPQSDGAELIEPLKNP